MLCARGFGFVFRSGPLKQRPQTFWAFDVLDPLDAVRSATVPTWVLLLWRITYLLYFIGAFAAESLADKSLPEPKWVSFFTNWTMTLMAIIGILGTVVLSMHLKRDPKASAYPSPTEGCSHQLGTGMCRSGA